MVLFQLSERRWIFFLIRELCLDCLSEGHSSGADRRGGEMPTGAKEDRLRLNGYLREEGREIPHTKELERDELGERAGNRIRSRGPRLGDPPACLPGSPAERWSLREGTEEVLGTTKERGCRAALGSSRRRPASLTSSWSQTHACLRGPRQKVGSRGSLPDSVSLQEVM